MGSDTKEKDKEMQKLYDAIGYSENEKITPFPKEVMNYLLILHCISLSLYLEPL